MDRLDEIKARLADYDKTKTWMFTEDLSQIQAIRRDDLRWLIRQVDTAWNVPPMVAAALLLLREKRALVDAVHAEPTDVIDRAYSQHKAARYNLAEMVENEYARLTDVELAEIAKGESQTVIERGEHKEK